MANKPSLIVTKTDGSVTSPDENKGKFNKTKNVQKSPQSLVIPGKPNKKQQQQQANSPKLRQVSRESEVPPRPLTAKQIEELRQTFNFFDKKKLGYITANEISTVMRSVGQNPTDAEVADMIHEIDIDGNGRLDFNEFAAMMSRRMKTEDEIQEELKESFKLFDLNGDGVISAHELRTVLTTLGEKMTDQEIAEVMRAWDLNKDGYIDYIEFSLAMSHGTIFE